MKYCAIDGSSYMGKTSICAELSAEGIPVIWEYDTQVDFDNSTVPRQSPEFIDLLIEAERRRTELLAGTTGSLVISDRSIVSLLTFEDMALTQGMGDRATRLALRAYLAARLYREIELGNIVTANCTAIVVIDDKSVFADRVAKRGITATRQLAEYQVGQFVTDRAVQYSKNLLGDNAVGRLDLSPYDLATATSKTLEVIEGLQPADTINLNAIREFAIWPPSSNS